MYLIRRGRKEKRREKGEKGRGGRESEKERESIFRFNHFLKSSY